MKYAGLFEQTPSLIPAAFKAFSPSATPGSSRVCDFITVGWCSR